MQVPNTLYLTECMVSPAVLRELTDKSRYEILGDPQEVAFDEEGRLVRRLKH